MITISVLCTAVDVRLAFGRSARGALRILEFRALPSGAISRQSVK